MCKSRRSDIASQCIRYFVDNLNDIECSGLIVNSSANFVQLNATFLVTYVTQENEVYHFDTAKMKDSITM